MPNRYVSYVGAPGTANGSFPPAFLIGSHTITQPLVDITYVKAHLSLLGAFKALEQRVETCLEDDLPVLARGLDSTEQKSRRWVWFVCLAVERFHRWAKCATANQDTESWVHAEAPPLDVLMVWHAYMLNPAWYGDDCLRVSALRTLRALNDRLLPALVVMGNPAKYRPSEERKPYLGEDGRGFAQQGFKLTCSCCSLAIDKPALALDKLASDLVKDHNDPDATMDAYLPGTLRSPTDLAYIKRARQIKDRIVNIDQFRQPKACTREEWRRKIKEDFDHSINNVHDTLRPMPQRALGLLKRMLNRILSAYTDDSPFSIDLVSAVIRQGSFTSKMHYFGWTAPGYFDKPIDEVVLVHAITRYHAFLDLMAPSPASFFVPTLDIDLVWHTHQLTAGKYADDCMEYVERYIDHDDKVEENHLANAFDVTCRVWQQRFGVPYTYCGCPLPGDSIGDKLQRLLRRRSEQPSDLCPPAHPDAPLATHASEHNAVQVQLSSALGKHKAAELRRQRELRERKMHERRKRDERRMLKGEFDPEQYQRGQRHDIVFMAAVPFISPAGPGATGSHDVAHGKPTRL
ncbi:uncharacterized protein B0H18DRAFT_1117014 [Fomitopsis serialis]|uniref:uncharacterized protein n=1 Tax=Fomitopsis serialis TaxID=139415 RepID=UPI002007CA2E|nr:uncharacterized protein B0H18DRAFT_1117014 [Neoantrodia serialis]KAH9930329.1 hypothetical protein B0H18DRAFT_1117014 [Neoantrodia serialis]